MACMATPTNSPEPAPRWTAGTVGMGEEILIRMERAVLKVRERLLRATAALNQAGVPYAVVGGNAVASWVATVDAGAVRNTRDVDILVRRADLPVITTALQGAGFVPSTTLDVVMFRDGEEGLPSEAIHLLFSGEKTRPDHLLPAPEIETAGDRADFRVLQLEFLLLMKLMSNCDKDRTHLRDLIALGLVDASDLAHLPPELAERLQHLLDTPDG